MRGRKISPPISSPNVTTRSQTKGSGTERPKKSDSDKGRGGTGRAINTKKNGRWNLKGGGPRESSRGEKKLEREVPRTNERTYDAMFGEDPSESSSDTTSESTHEGSNGVPKDNIEGEFENYPDEILSTSGESGMEGENIEDYMVETKEIAKVEVGEESTSRAKAVGLPESGGVSESERITRDMIINAEENVREIAKSIENEDNLRSPGKPYAENNRNIIYKTSTSGEIAVRRNKDKDKVGRSESNIERPTNIGFREKNQISAGTPDYSEGSQSFDFSSQSDSEEESCNRSSRKDCEDSVDDYILQSFSDMKRSLPRLSYNSSDGFEILDNGNFFAMRLDANKVRARGINTSISFLKSDYCLRKIGGDFGWFEKGCFDFFLDDELYSVQCDKDISSKFFDIKPIISIGTTEDELFRYSPSKAERDIKRVHKNITKLLDGILSEMSSQIKLIGENISNYKELNETSSIGYDIILTSLLFSYREEINNLQTLSTEIMLASGLALKDSDKDSPPNRI